MPCRKEKQDQTANSVMRPAKKNPWPKKRYLALGLTFVLLTLTTSFCAFRAFKANVDIEVTEDKEEGHFKFRIEGDAVPEGASVSLDQCGTTSDNDKFDCHPEPNATEAECLDRSCCWSPTAPAEIVGPPSCYYPSHYSGYQVVKIHEAKWGLLAILKRKTPSPFPKDIQKLHVKVMIMDEDRVNIKISDPNVLRYEVPFPKLRPTFRGRSDGMKFDVAVGYDGRLTVTRKSTGTKILDANLATMTFADQFLQLSIMTPTEGYYGLGETKDALLRGKGWRRYILFNRDNYPIKEVNMYGTHPFYLQMEKDGNGHGVFLFNSNSMEVITQPTPAITFRTIGGVLDFYVFLGPSPGQVIEQYTQLIGRSFMPPYWSLGFHLCRYGYGSLETTRATWKRTIDAKIPFDVQWNDIDYMDNYNDFTVDPVRYANLSSFVDEIHEANMRYVMITDVGIGGADLAGSYPPYDDGVAMGCLVKDEKGDPILGKVWNKGSTAYPDFTHPRASEYLTKQYQHLYSLAKYDGSWIDMNEPANFVNGSLDGCPEDSSLENPPYIPGNLEPLYTRTLCMTAQHHASTHYNVHNIHSLTQAITTNTALRNILNRRPFIISRSTFAGFGAFAGHWNGDISSNWEDYRWSIPSILTFGMFGVSMMGADICGFKWNTTEELCARWQTLGAFYPFARNHNDFDTFEQDPVIMGPIVEKAARDSLLIRYRLLPFLYTLFYRSHVFGETVARPLFFEYPKDIKTYAIDNVFLWGQALLIVPVLEAEQNETKAYIPEDVWYDFYSGQQVPNTGSVLEFHSLIDEITLLLRGGHVIPTQEPAVNTVLSRKNKFGLLVALKNGKATGELYWDEGDSLETFEKKEYNLIQFSVAEQTLNCTVIEHGYTTEMTLGDIELFGVEPLTRVTVDQRDVEFSYDSSTKVLHITGLSLSLLGNFTMQWT